MFIYQTEKMAKYYDRVIEIYKQTAAGMADLSYWCYLFTRWKTMGVVLKSAALLVQPWSSRQLPSS